MGQNIESIRKMRKCGLRSWPGWNVSDSTMAASHRTVRTRVESFADPNSDPDPASSSFPQRHLVDNLQKFCKYSSAAYGQVGIFSSKLT